jgi:hypothetical protein
MRLLPWTCEGGRPAYLSTDDEGSYVSRLADNLEAVQLGMAEDLLGHVQKTMTEEKSSEPELRSVVTHLCQALRDALRVAESRGDRLPFREEDELSAAADGAIDREIAR